MKAVILDAFGTAVRIGNRSSPYKQAGATRDVMKSPIPLDSLTSDPALLEALDDELASISVYSDFWPFAEFCRARRISVAIGSNLAIPYGEVLRRLIGPAVDHYHLSYEVGLTKPDRRFFLSACDALNAQPAETIMIGDSTSSDILGARGAGLLAARICRPRGTLFDFLPMLE